MFITPKKISVSWDHFWLLIMLIAFLLYLAAIFVHLPANVLTGDEVFYYFQAQHLKIGKLIWFEHTQPFFYPLFLSLFPAKVTLLRMINLSVMGLSGLLFYLVAKRYLNAGLSFVAGAIFLVHPYTIQMASLLYTEGLFLLLTFIDFILYRELLKRPSRRLYPFFLGITLGFTLQTRVVGLVILLALFCHLLSNNFSHRKLAVKQLIFSSFLALLMFVPYLWLGGYKFMVEKQSLNLAENAVVSLINLGHFLGWPWFGITFLSVILYLTNTRKKNEFIDLCLIILVIYLDSTIVFPAVFERYFFVILPFAVSLIVYCFFSYKKYFWGKVYQLMFLGALILSFPAIIDLYRGKTDLVNQGRKLYNRFELSPRNCLDLKNWQYDCSQTQAEKIKLPFFSQPEQSTCQYQTSFMTREEFRQIRIAYLSDKVLAVLDDQFLFESADVFHMNLIDQKFSSGQHTLSLKIFNGSNIGGIGQVLICKEKLAQVK